MKKLVYLVVLCFLSLSFAHAQRAEHMEKLKSVKIGMITERLALSAEQAKTFWPIYNQYEAEKRKLYQETRQKLRPEPGSSRTEEAELSRQDDLFEMKEMELELTKKYRPKFLTSITAKQYSDLLLAEREFNQMLIKELRERKGRP